MEAEDWRAEMNEGEGQLWVGELGSREAGE